MPTGEYDAYLQKQEATFRTEVTAVVPEPKVADVPPIVVSRMEQMTTTVISGQVGVASAAECLSVFMCVDVDLLPERQMELLEHESPQWRS